MIKIKKMCPTPEEINKYFKRELDEARSSQIEEHFTECECFLGQDYYMDYKSSIALSPRIVKAVIANKVIDYFDYAAANDSEVDTEIESSNSNFILRLMTVLDEPETAILVLRVLNSCISGRIQLCYSEDGINKTLLEGEIEEEMSVLVSSNIKLKNIIIMADGEKEE